MNLTLHNTLTRAREVFTPLEPGRVRMYVCGITPYDVCHLGHARCYVVFDLVRRVLRANGYQVQYIQNFTDVDDKIIARAQERGVPVRQLAQTHIDDYFKKMDALGIERAESYPRVTESIPEIIELIKELVQKKAAYPLNGDVYFSVRNDAGYGKLSNRPLEELISGARVEVDKDKKDPLDFALWKGAKPDEPADVTWPSPWGPGRPGWHIECSAMAIKHLRSPFDIHGGGLDLIFPHHENEIAQSETATGGTFARVWLHNGFVTINREKMSKSLGNFFSLEEIFATYEPAAVRYMLLSVHYRSPLDFSSELLDQSRQSLAGIKDAIARALFVTERQGKPAVNAAEATVQAALAPLHEAFHAALNDDFNSPGALGVLHQVLGLLEKQIASDVVHAPEVCLILDQVREMAQILGLDLFSAAPEAAIPAELTALAQQREAARQAKQWGEADRLRQELSQRGYAVEDTPQGPRLLRKPA